jgi:hypothetical protein
MVKGFSVTFERWDDAAAEAGDTNDHGFVIENVSLSDAMRDGLEYLKPEWSGFCEANEYPVRAPQWLTWPNWNENTREWYETSIIESRSLHIPEGVTSASRRRIARLFAAYSL